MAKEHIIYRHREVDTSGAGISEAKSTLGAQQNPLFHGRTRSCSWGSAPSSLQSPPPLSTLAALEGPWEVEAAPAACPPGWMGSPPPPRGPAVPSPPSNRPVTLPPDAATPSASPSPPLLVPLGAGATGVPEREGGPASSPSPLSGSNMGCGSRRSRPGRLSGATAASAACRWVANWAAAAVENLAATSGGRCNKEKESG